jgi:hypothetical protein
MLVGWLISPAHNVYQLCLHCLATRYEKRIYRVDKLHPVYKIRFLFLYHALQSGGY